jgi:hypothetical protein
MDWGKVDLITSSIQAAITVIAILVGGFWSKEFTSIFKQNKSIFSPVWLQDCQRIGLVTELFNITKEGIAFFKKAMVETIYPS